MIKTAALYKFRPIFHNFLAFVIVGGRDTRQWRRNEINIAGARRGPPAAEILVHLGYSGELSCYAKLRVGPIDVQFTVFTCLT